MKHLLLLHGALGSASHFNLITPLLETDFIVHALHLPGHGGSEMPSNFSIEFFADHVEEYCRIHSLAEINIFGFSMGGYVAVYLAHKNPSLVNKVMTLGTIFHWDELIAAKEVSRLRPAAIELKIPQFAEDLKNLHYPNEWKVVVEKTADMLTSLGKKNLLSPEVLALVRCPVLVMVGDRDKMVSRDMTIRVFELLPVSQLAILPGTPHPLEMCDTGLLALMIKKFFK